MNAMNWKALPQRKKFVVVRAVEEPAKKKRVRSDEDRSAEGLSALDGVAGEFYECNELQPISATFSFFPDTSAVVCRSGPHC
jgi:hypothetical protein